jgi:hypothetical protein
MNIKKLQEVMTSEFLMIDPSHIEFDKLTKLERDNLKQEARAILGSDLFKWIVEEMKRAARKQMDEKAVDFEGVLGGRFMFYTLSVLEEKLRNIAK